MKISYQPKGICASRMEIEVEDDKIVDVNIYGGCEGNHQGIVNLVKGMSVADVIEKLEGISCGPRASSCPDQLAQALKTIR